MPGVEAMGVEAVEEEGESFNNAVRLSLVCYDMCSLHDRHRGGSRGGGSGGGRYNNSTVSTQLKPWTALIMPGVALCSLFAMGRIMTKGMKIR